ncbi:ArsA-related P-loop ATPase [Methylotenera sp.]|uniref:nucleotide-binding protein n=1 Tax=Methylotenera sp. TaxID=2051956 RepID=UPI00248832BB|nr:ArsA-related P-loop ATPase [Methylotenera sp.]MDI1298609.1 ArsA-related P-loop ATPase [Methylotenera sp.]
MNRLHLTLQGKGGVGKSLVSCLIAQYLKTKNKKIKCYDTDPVNQTLQGFKALDVEHIQLLEGSKINERNFDVLMEKILTTKTPTVIDNGASSFVPLSNYIIENDVITMMQDNGHQIIMHIIITGGQGLADTMNGFYALAEQTKGKNIVVWLNEYFGEVAHEGKEFTEMKAYTDNTDKVLGILKLTKRNPDTFGKDIEQMVTSKLTFEEAINSPDFSIMAKQRLKTVQSDIYKQLDAIGELNG